MPITLKESAARRPTQARPRPVDFSIIWPGPANLQASTRLYVEIHNYSCRKYQDEQVQYEHAVAFIRVHEEIRVIMHI